MRCSECGGKFGEDALLATPPPGPILAAVARAGAALSRRAGMILLVLVLGFLCVFISSGMMVRRGCCRPLSPRLALLHLFKAAAVYASDSSGAYPTHVALLTTTYDVDSRLLVTYSHATGQPNQFIGDVDLTKFDGSPSAIGALQAAIQQMDLSAQYYPAGNYWFARLQRPTGRGDIVFGWSGMSREGKRWAVFDDGGVAQLDFGAWHKAWRADAGARRKLNLPPMGAPP